MSLPRSLRRPRWGYDVERSILAAIHHLNEHLDKVKEQIVSNFDDVAAGLEDKITQLGDAITTEVQQLKDAIAAGQQLTPEQLDRLGQIGEKMSAGLSSLQADDPAAPPAPGA